MPLQRQPPSPCRSAAGHRDDHEADPRSGAGNRAGPVASLPSNTRTSARQVGRPSPPSRSRAAGTATCRRSWPPAPAAQHHRPGPVSPRRRRRPMNPNRHLGKPLRRHRPKRGQQLGASRSLWPPTPASALEWRSAKTRARTEIRRGQRSQGASNAHRQARRGSVPLNAREITAAITTRHQWPLHRRRLTVDAPDTSTSSCRRPRPGSRSHRRADTRRRGGADPEGHPCAIRPASSTI